ncbi:hypothetical protein SETIT_7G190500v2 [Setaria italica]|uniref:Uncharacterized protein n=2 Tax=Setaria TaxID=4554 RepID=A0A368RXH6_SETIT|nr:hypothetical protein SETIT_7G190500v2 [Setaria italica]TKW05841.1 hypothetical protein SEVIR_7G202500v2 [Setaria viridis]
MATDTRAAVSDSGIRCHIQDAPCLFLISPLHPSLSCLSFLAATTGRAAPPVAWSFPALRRRRASASRQAAMLNTALL